MAFTSDVWRQVKWSDSKAGGVWNTIHKSTSGYRHGIFLLFSSLPRPSPVTQPTVLDRDSLHNYPSLLLPSVVVIAILVVAYNILYLQPISPNVRVFFSGLSTEFDMILGTKMAMRTCFVYVVVPFHFCTEWPLLQLSYYSLQGLFSLHPRKPGQISIRTSWANHRASWCRSLLYYLISLTHWDSSDPWEHQRQVPSWMPRFLPTHSWRYSVFCARLSSWCCQQVGDECRGSALTSINVVSSVSIPFSLPPAIARSDTRAWLTSNLLSYSSFSSTGHCEQTTRWVGRSYAWICVIPDISVLEFVSNLSGILYLTKGKVTSPLSFHILTSWLGLRVYSAARSLLERVVSSNTLKVSSCNDVDFMGFALPPGTFFSSLLVFLGALVVTASSLYCYCHAFVSFSSHLIQPICPCKKGHWTSPLKCVLLSNAWAYYITIDHNCIVW